jgi:hypothetical protein
MHFPKYSTDDDFIFVYRVNIKKIIMVHRKFLKPDDKILGSTYSSESGHRIMAEYKQEKMMKGGDIDAVN